MKENKVSNTLIIIPGIVLLLVLVSGISGEQVAGEHIGIGDTSTLSELLSYAAINNPGLKAAFFRWKSAIEGVTGQKSLSDPKFTFSYFISEVETRVGPQQSKLGIMQMFPWFGKLRLKGKAAMSMVDSEEQMYEQTKLNIFFQVKKNYFDYYFILQNISVIKENIRLLKYLESVAEKKYRSGITPYTDLIKIQIESEKLLDQLRSAEELIIPIQTRLNAVLNRPVNAPLPVPALNAIRAVHFSRNQLVDWMLENNPELKALDFRIEHERIAIRVARKNYLPDFSIGLDYVFTGEARMADVVDSGKDPIMAMLQINVPIWFSRIKSEVNRAKNILDSVLEEKSKKKNTLIADLDMVYYQYRDAERKVSLYRDQMVPRARQALDVSRSAYKTGNMDILNLVDAQRTLLDFQLHEKELQVLRAIKLAELELLTGRIF